MTKPIVLHLLDDVTPGGVTRVVDHLMASPVLNAQAVHHRRVLNGNKLSAPTMQADIIVSHLTMSWRNLPMLISLRAKHPNAVLIHVEHSYTKSFTALNVTNRERFFTLLRTGIALFDQVVAVSRAQGSWLVTRGLVAQDRLQVIRSAVDLMGFAALPAPSGVPKVFGAIGRLHEQKGFDGLIAAFAKVDAPDIRLKVFGEGPMQATLEGLAAADPRVTLEGFRPDPVQAIAEIDALLVPSRWEAFGLVAQEALAAGRMTLVAPIDGLLDQETDGARVVSGLGNSVWTQAITAACTVEAGPSVVNQTDMAERQKQRFQKDWSRLFGEALQKELQPAA